MDTCPDVIKRGVEIVSFLRQLHISEVSSTKSRFVSLYDGARLAMLAIETINLIPELVLLSLIFSLDLCLQFEF